MVGRPYCRSQRGWEALPEVRQWSVSPPKGPGVVDSLSPEVEQWSVGPPIGPGVVRRPSERFGSGREALPEVRE